MTLEKHVCDEGKGFYMPLGDELQSLVREHEFSEYNIQVKDIMNVVKPLLIQEAMDGKTTFTLTKDAGNEAGVGCLFESSIISRAVIDDMRYNHVQVYRKRNDTLGVYALEFNWED